MQSRPFLRAVSGSVSAGTAAILADESIGLPGDGAERRAAAIFPLCQSITIFVWYSGSGCALVRGR
jgi:hypothetical protein